MPSFFVCVEEGKICRVTEGLFMGGVAALASVDEILAMGIDLIVNATTEVPNLRLDGVERIKLWVDDAEREDLSLFFDAVADHVERIRESGGSTLIHCLAGVSRSAALCLAYLVKCKDMSLREAYKHLAARRRCVRPNLSFWKQLIEYECRLRGGSSVKMVASQLSVCGGENKLLPDVYLGEEKSEGLPTVPEAHRGHKRGRERRGSGGHRSKFAPTLETVMED